MGPASRVDMGLQPGVPYGVQAQGVGVQARVTPLLLLGGGGGGQLMSAAASHAARTVYFAPQVTRPTPSRS